MFTRRHFERSWECISKCFCFFCKDFGAGGGIKRKLPLCISNSQKPVLKFRKRNASYAVFSCWSTPRCFKICGTCFVFQRNICGDMVSEGENIYLYILRWSKTHQLQQHYYYYYCVGEREYSVKALLFNIVSVKTTSHFQVRWIFKWRFQWEKRKTC